MKNPKPIEVAAENEQLIWNFVCGHCKAINSVAAELALEWGYYDDARPILASKKCVSCNAINHAHRIY